MMNEKIRHAYDSIHPTDEQKNRMLRNIVTKMPAENGKNYTSFPTEPKRRSVIFAGLALLLVVCASALYLLARQPEDNPQLSQGDTNPTETQNNEYEQQRLQIMLDLEEKELTYDLIERYRSFVLKLIALDQKPAPEYYEEYGISCLARDINSIEQLGYLVTDLDENGTPEVIISDGKVIYDLYTLERGEYLHLFSSGEENTFELCKGNYIFNTVSDGEGGTTYQVFLLNGGELEVVTRIASEASAESISWYIISHDHWSRHRFEVDREQAVSKIQNYDSVPIEITPFAEREDREREIP